MHHTSPARITRIKETFIANAQSVAKVSSISRASRSASSSTRRRRRRRRRWHESPSRLHIGETSSADAALFRLALRDGIRRAGHRAHVVSKVPLFGKICCISLSDPRFLRRTVVAANCQTPCIGRNVCRQTTISRLAEWIWRLCPGDLRLDWIWYDKRMGNIAYHERRCYFIYVK